MNYRIVLAYWLGGTLFGLIVPFAVLQYELLRLQLDFSWSNFMLAQSMTPVTKLAYLAPVFFGVFLLVAGIYHARLDLHK